MNRASQTKVGGYIKSKGMPRAGIAARAIVALVASFSALGLFALEPGRPDPRTRTFLPPVRVVWLNRGEALFNFSGGRHF